MRLKLTSIETALQSHEDERLGIAPDALTVSRHMETSAPCLRWWIFAGLEEGGGTYRGAIDLREVINK